MKRLSNNHNKLIYIEVYNYFISVHGLSADSQYKVLKDYDSFAFAISTHGIEEEKVNEDQVVHNHTVTMFDEKDYYTEDILDHFSPMRCRALRGKPKLFFIQVRDVLAFCLIIQCFTSCSRIFSFAWKRHHYR
jgi:hypothetical protein